MSFHALRSLAFSAALLAASCSDSNTAPPRTPDEAAGEYVLASVSGRGPSSGTMTLRAEGSVDRRIQYAARTPPVQSYQLGTWKLDAQGIAFSLREAISSSSYEWPVRGEWRGKGFSIRYPDPADGPDIVETYERR